MEKKKSFFERRPYVCYALYAGLLFAFNLFLRWWSGELDADEYLMSAINTLILKLQCWPVTVSAPKSLP